MVESPHMLENVTTLDSTEKPVKGEKKVAKQKSSNFIYFLIQMFASFADNMTNQFLPVYTRRLGASETQMGLFTAVSNVGKTGFQPLWGRLSDYKGRKVFMLSGSFIAMASIFTMIFAHTPGQVIISVALYAFSFSIFFPAWQGAIADYTEGKKRGGFMGRLLGVSYIYIAIALLAYTFIVPILHISDLAQFRLVIAIAGVNFGIVTLISWVMIDLKNPDTSEDHESMLTPLKDAAFRKFLIVILFWWFWMSLAWSYFPLVISDVINATPIQVAYIAISATLLQAVTSYSLADYIDRVGERRAIFIGFLSFTVVPINYAFATSWYWLIPAQLISGIGRGFGFAALQSYLIEMGGSKRAGNYQGIYQLLWGVVTFTGSLLGGLILGWYVQYLGDISKALTISLLVIAVLRLSSNIVIYKFLPDPVSELQDYQ